jgi:PHD/YefM family antitoxin component YafN of YafNO toxin-antitoxin module
VKVAGEELVAMSEFRQNLPTIINELRAGEKEKVVLTRHGQFECVVLSPEAYEKLEAAHAG